MCLNCILWRILHNGGRIFKKNVPINELGLLAGAISFRDLASTTSVGSIYISSWHVIMLLNYYRIIISDMTHMYRYNGTLRAAVGLVFCATCRELGPRSEQLSVLSTGNFSGCMCVHVRYIFVNCTHDTGKIGVSRLSLKKYVCFWCYIRWCTYLFSTANDT